MVRLGDICTKQASNIKQSDLTENEGIYPIFGASGFIKNVDFYQQEKPCVAVVKDGAGVGRVIKLPAYSSAIGTMQYIIPNPGIDSSYLAYLLEYLNLSRYYTGAAIPHIYFKDYSKEQIILHSEEEQRKITRVLDHVCNLISMRKQQLAKLDELVKARFVEMFGDTLNNTMGLPESRLDSVADIVSGITKGRKIKSAELFDVPYMAVSNVKDGYIDWTTVKTISATKDEINQYRLKPGDVLMTEGGDPDKLGRGAIIHVPPRDCIHQNHIFRVRLDRNVVLPIYMEQYLQHQRAKRYFLSCAKQTTGIASINMRQLSALPMLIPSLEMQEQFDFFVNQIDKSKFSLQQSLSKLETLKKALMQSCFE